MGDVVITTSIIPIIKSIYPNVELDFLIGSWAKPIFQYNPNVRLIHILDHWKLNRSNQSNINKWKLYLRSYKKVIKEGFFRITSRLKKSFIKRAIEVDVIKEHMNKSPFPIIICGDFNDTPNSYAYKKISHGLKDSFLEQGIGIGSTFLGKIPFLRIDYILHSPRLKTNTFTTYIKS